MLHVAPIGVLSQGVIPIAIAFTASAVSSANNTAYTFSSQSIGTASADRQILVGAVNGDGVSISTLTVGGVSATKLVGAADNRAELWIASVPTGTTAAIVVTYSTGNSRCGIGVWAVTGAASTASDTLVSNANPMTGTIDVPIGGGVIACCVLNGGTTTVTWTGVTEDYDATVESASSTHSGGYAEVSAGETGRTITATPASGLSNRAMAAVALGPA